MTVRKFVGISSMIVGLVALVVGLFIVSEIVKASISYPGATGLEVALAFATVFIISGFLLGIGSEILTNKEENIKENPDNPLICRHCRRDYDKTWKVCLNCGKPLIEKQPS